MNVTPKTETLDAIEVTDLEEAAEFCGTVVAGETVRVTTPEGVTVNARIGDYIVDTGHGCNVYSQQSFDDHFDVVPETADEEE